MSHDKSEPKVGLIIQIGLVSILTVVGTRFGLISYYNRMNDDEHFRKIAAIPHAELAKVREDEKKMLTGGPMSIDKSMQQLASEKGADPQMAPKPADPLREKDTMAGWMMMPKDLPHEEHHDDKDKAPTPAPSTSSSAAPATSSSAAPATSGSAAPPTSAAPSSSAQHAPAPQNSGGEHH